MLVDVTQPGLMNAHSLVSPTVSLAKHSLVLFMKDVHYCYLHCTWAEHGAGKCGSLMQGGRCSPLPTSRLSVSLFCLLSSLPTLFILSPFYLFFSLNLHECSNMTSGTTDSDDATLFFCFFSWTLALEISKSRLGYFRSLVCCDGFPWAVSCQTVQRRMISLQHKRGHWLKNINLLLPLTVTELYSTQSNTHRSFPSS